MADPDRNLERLMEQIRAEAAALRRAAREADIELATMAAMARRKRERLRREAKGTSEGADEQAG